MQVYIKIAEDFSHPHVQPERFSMDVESTTTIENLKVLITLRYVDLGPDEFDLLFENRKIDLNLQIYQLLKSDDQLHFLMVSKTKQCCCIIY